MLLEPCPVSVILGAEGADDQPELRRVRRFGQVRQFVHNDVVENWRRGHDQAPVKGQIPSARAAPPFGPLIHDVDSARSPPHLPASLHDTGIYRLSCSLSQPPLQHPRRLSRHGFRETNTNLLPGILHDPIFPQRVVLPDQDARRVPAEQDRRREALPSRYADPPRPTEEGQLVENPDSMFSEKPRGTRLLGALRQDYLHPSWADANPRLARAHRGPNPIVHPLSR
jgi:hypothetical protein